MVAFLLSLVAGASALQTQRGAPQRRPRSVARGGVRMAVSNSAFVFVKPHAVTDATVALVRAQLSKAGVRILSEGDITSEEIDSQKLVDQHYYAIASKATITPPAELTVPADKFKETFGEEWADVLAAGRAVTAIDACKKLGIDGAAMDKAWGAAKGAGDIVKLGGGFYAGRLPAPKGGEAIYTFNGFYMSMRDRFTQPGGSIHYYVVEFDAEKLPWAQFRGSLLGPTDPAAAPADSIRGQIFSQWKALGLKAEPDTGDNGVHASASPFEGLCERANWLKVSFSDDAFGKALLDAGISEKTFKAWSVDPAVQTPSEKRSLFDFVEDTDVDACIEKLKSIV
ncbi:nucleoside diphosphate kinase [Pelagophyceae sp. CCMP2097]|nr:nucleoside diphosphate kinase [Pelagophyceae sp. CCMP2097]